MTKILNKCPVCGSGLQYHSMMQFTEDFVGFFIEYVECEDD